MLWSRSRFRRPVHTGREFFSVRSYSRAKRAIFCSLHTPSDGVVILVERRTETVFTDAVSTSESHAGQDIGLAVKAR